MSGRHRNACPNDAGIAVRIDRNTHEDKLIKFWRGVEVDAEYIGEQLSELDPNYARAYAQLGWIAEDFLISLVSASRVIQRSQHTNGDFKDAFRLVVRARNASLPRIYGHIHLEL